MRCKTIAIAVVLLALAASCGLFLAMRVTQPAQQSFSSYSLLEEQRTLEQNWTADLRQQMHYLSFGSRMLPYAIFMALEQSHSRQKFADPAHLEQFGFIAQKSALNNPSGLPVGMALDTGEDGEPWVGFSCAACHTGLLKYQGVQLLIDGAPGMVDFQSFEQAVYTALRDSLDNRDKFVRITQALGATNHEKVTALRDQLGALALHFEHLLQINATDVPYGHARLDAFGRIFNAVAVTALGIDSNRRSPNAPVSFPVLWDASHLDVVQWNGSAPNRNPGPLGQNVTTALAVYGSIHVMPGELGYESTVRVDNLGFLQEHYYALQSPSWPETLLGEIDKALVARGENIYQSECQRCHQRIDTRARHRELTATVIAQTELGTDPWMARNFATAVAHTGELGGLREALIFGSRFGLREPTIELVTHVAFGAMLGKPLQSLAAYNAENRKVGRADINRQQQVYKARALNGVWASAPFLHNGSVPTLWDLLQAPDQRPVAFYVKSQEFDPRKVGYVSEYVAGASRLDTTQLGNSNAGHIYGTALSEADKWALLEFLKTL